MNRVVQQAELTRIPFKMGCEAGLSATHAAPNFLMFVVMTATVLWQQPFYGHHITMYPMAAATDAKSQRSQLLTTFFSFSWLFESF